MSAPRVVSLLSSATEIVYGLGCQSYLVGRSHECDFPPEVLCLPQCSRPRIDVTGSSREIDERVKSSASQGLSLYDIDRDRLRELQPDIILTQTQCEVCAVSLKDVEAAVCELLDSPAKIVSLHPNSLADLWRDIRLIGRELNVVAQDEGLVERLTSRLQALQHATTQLQTRPRVVCLEWLDPLMAAGNWVPELVEIAGGSNTLGIPGEHSPWMDWDALVAARPDVIVALPCGWDIAKASQELLPLTSHPAWISLPAVQTGRVYITDGNQYFNRPGPRLVESAEILAEIFHSEHFDFGHRSRGAWVNFRSSDVVGVVQ